MVANMSQSFNEAQYFVIFQTEIQRNNFKHLLFSVVYYGA